jgi:hypothetical protein
MDLAQSFVENDSHSISEIKASHFAAGHRDCKGPIAVTIYYRRRQPARLAAKKQAVTGLIASLSIREPGLSAKAIEMLSCLGGLKFFDASMAKKLHLVEVLNGSAAHRTLPNRKAKPTDQVQGSPRGHA